MSLIRPFVLILSPFTLAAIAAILGGAPTQAQVIEAKTPQQLAQVSPSGLEAKILHEVNRVRTNPARYAIWLESLRQYYDGMTLSLPGQPPLETQEGLGALDEAINDLRQRRPVLPLVASDPLSQQAQNALTSNAPSGNSARLENSTVPIWAVMHLVVADGQRDRTARHNLLSIAHRSTGVACDANGNLCSLSYDSAPVSTAVTPVEPIPVVPIAVEPIPVAPISETVDPPNTVAPEVAVEPTPSEITATTLPEITTPEVTADPLASTTPEETVEPSAPPSSTLPSEVSIEPITPEIQPEITLEPIPEATVEPSPEIVVEPIPEAIVEPTPEATVTTSPETLPPPIEVAVEPTTPEISPPIPEDPLPELTTPIPEPNPQIVSLLNPDPQTLAQGYLLLSEGALEPNDQRYEDGSFYDEHLFQGGQGQSITINLSSNEFDTFLAVFDANGQQVLAQNDDAGGSSNSSVTMTLPYDGLYRIFVNGYNESDLGSYAISIK